MKPISELRNKYQGYDIHVVASGASAGYIEPSYFDNKIAIGVNQVWRRFGNLDYIVMKDRNSLETTRAASQACGFKLILSRYNCGSYGNGKNPEDADYIFDHNNNELKALDLSIVGTDKLVVSYSTTTTAIHLAAYMGAANIIVVGHDCGTLDGQMNFPGYSACPLGETFYSQFITEIEPQTLTLREKIKEVYGTNVYSLNPFINFGLEGHKYANE